MKNIQRIALTAIVASMLFGIEGCSTTAVGATAGAVGGAVLTGGSAAGVVGGAVVGGVIGHEMK
jgi:osmotically inducible lipoprotein OsmB